MADRVGQKLGNYTLMRLLGWGGFAEVYLGKHIHLNNLTAIKVLYAQLSREDREQFLTEARTLVRLDHPHIVRVLDFGVEDNTPFLVMSYAPNGTLRQRYPRHTILPLPTIVSYVKQIASALQYLHEHKLIHRDLKPENLLLDANDEVLLSDFGTVVLVQTISTQSLENMAGTVIYMAPEQLQGRPRQASDQYGLAVITYEWLCGECPFQGSFTALSTQHLLTPPPPLREKNPNIPPDVEHVVMTALSKDPQQRFGSVKAFARALEQAYNAEPLSKVTEPIRFLPPAPTQSGTDAMRVSTLVETHAEEKMLPLTPATTPRLSPSTPITPMPVTDEAMPPTLPIPPTPAKKRLSRRTAVAGLAGLALVGIAGGSFALSKLSQTPPIVVHPKATATIAATPTVTKSLTVYTYHGHKDWVNALAWSPNGTRIATASADSTLQIWDATTGGQAVTYPYNNRLRAVAWSPNGKFLASGGRDKVVEVQNMPDGTVLLTYYGHFKWLSAVAWSSDSKRIASASLDRTIHIWDPMTGNNFFILRGHTDEVSSVAWSPNGNYIASASSDRTVRIWDTTTGRNIFTYHGHNDVVKSVTWSLDSTQIISGSGDTTVQVWHAMTGKRTLTYYGHKGGVNAVALSADGQRVASASTDRTVQIWDASSGHLQLTYQGHGNAAVFTVAWSPAPQAGLPNVQLVASGAGDNTARVWKTS